MRGVDGASWNNKRLRGVAFAFQVRKHVIEAQRDVAKNVLTNDPSGPAALNNGKHRWPEMAVIFRASALPGFGEWLAWVSAANNVGAVFSAINGAHIVMNGNFRPVLFQNRTAERVDFAERDGLHTRPFETQRKAANAGKEIENAHSSDRASDSIFRLERLKLFHRHQKQSDKIVCISGHVRGTLVATRDNSFGQFSRCIGFLLWCHRPTSILRFIEHVSFYDSNALGVPLGIRVAASAGQDAVVKPRLRAEPNRRPQVDLEKHGID